MLCHNDLSGIVDLGGGERARFDGVSLTVCAGDGRERLVNCVQYEGGDNVLVCGGVVNEEAVVVGCTNGVNHPSLARVLSANGELQGVHVISLDWSHWW